jgi:hypothetical protein
MSKAAVNSMSLMWYPPQVDVHQTGHDVVVFGIAIEMHPLDESRGAVAHADDGHTDFLVSHDVLPPEEMG